MYKFSHGTAVFRAIFKKSGLSIQTEFALMRLDSCDRLKNLLLRFSMRFVRCSGRNCEHWFVWLPTNTQSHPLPFACTKHIGQNGRCPFMYMNAQSIVHSSACIYMHGAISGYLHVLECNSSAQKSCVHTPSWTSVPSCT